MDTLSPIGSAAERVNSPFCCGKRLSVGGGSGWWPGHLNAPGARTGNRPAHLYTAREDRCVSPGLVAGVSEEDPLEHVMTLSFAVASAIGSWPSW